MPALGSMEGLSPNGKWRIESDMTRSRSTRHANARSVSLSKLSMGALTWSKQGGSCLVQCFGISTPSDRIS